jgi:hypothetical protein
MTSWAFTDKLHSQANVNEDGDFPPAGMDGFDAQPIGWRWAA